MSASAAIAILAKLAKAAIRYACETDERDRAQWLGGWSCVDFGKERGTQLWKCKSDKRDPLRLHVFSLGLEYAGLPPDGAEIISDGGSIPKPVQGSKKLHLRPDDFMRSYTLHDAIYKSGFVYVRDPAKSSAWSRITVKRNDADMLLFVGLTADQTPDGERASIADCNLVYRAVELGAGGAWDRYREAKG